MIQDGLSDKKSRLQSRRRHKRHKIRRMRHRSKEKRFIMSKQFRPESTGWFRRLASRIPRLRLNNCIMALAGSAVLAFGLYHIHSFSGVTEGGVLGMTLLLQHWFSISPAVSGLIMNILCYLLGWKLLGKEFIGYSVIAGGGFSLFYAIIEHFPPLFPGLSEHPLVASIAGALFVGIGVGLSVRAGGAPGGDDALAMSLSHVTKINLRWIYLFTDFVVLLLSISYIPLTRIWYSLLTVLLSGQLIGIMQYRRKKKDKETTDSPSTQ